MAACIAASAGYVWTTPLAAQGQNPPARPTPATPAPTTQAPATQAPTRPAPTTPAPTTPTPTNPAPAGQAQAPASATAQPAGQNPSTVCGLPIPAPARQPPAGSGPIVYLVVPCFQKQGGFSVIDPQTYVYYIQLHGSRPSENVWIPWNDKAEQTAVGDFKRLWETNFLDNLVVDVQDYHFSNGVLGKLVVYDMEERERVKIVDYVGSKKVEQSKIDEELKKQNLQIRLDSFIDQGLVNHVAAVVREMYGDKGYEYATVKPEIKPVSTDTKTVNLTFHINEGPKVRIQNVHFLGNNAIPDSKLASKMKDNKGPNKWLSLFFLGSPGTYKENKFEDDAQKVTDYYREKGYVKAQIGQPQLRILEDSKDGKTRLVQLQVPVTEGPRYKIGEINFSGNTVVKAEGLRPLFKVQEGDWFDEKKIRKGFDKAKELYGSGGYWEFTAAPEYSFPDDAKAPTDNAQGAAAAGPPPKPSAGAAGPPPPPSAGQPGTTAVTSQAASSAHHNPFYGMYGWTPWFDHEDPTNAPRANVTLRIEEGKQYFVHRITFTGNTTTRDNVIRREIRLYEGGVFNTEALKMSVRRVNQLGYFKPLEGEAVDVQKVADPDSTKAPQVDVKLKVQEQNRNQITFGAGVSQYEGFFGQLAFQTSNFLGRGETFSVSAQQGSLAKNYNVGFTEPFLFDRPITAGIQVFDQEIQYVGQFTQNSKGATTTWGFPLGPFSRLFATYSYQNVQVTQLNPLYTQTAALQNNPFLADSLLLNENGARKISKIGPSYVYNTVDNPIFPTNGRKVTLGADFAGLGGNTKFYDLNAEGIYYKKLNTRTSLGFRAATQYIDPIGKLPNGDPEQLPIFEKVVLGGEYSIRGFDLRSVGPRDLRTGLVLGGNKSLLGNAEYLINIAGPVRLVLFYDIGQVKDVGQGFSMKEPVQILTTVNNLLPTDSTTALYATTGFNSSLATRVDTIGETSAWKTSTGAEIRFFMPVLNVPFRLIFAANPSRTGVLNNNLQPESLWKFRFAVGTTF
jgi:outer membrane protein assembly factor BamA